MNTGKEVGKLAMKRVQLDLAPGTMSDLDFLKIEIEAASYAEVLRRYVKFIKILVLKMKHGATFYIKEKDGTMTQIIF